jgi:hypothetical protein
MHLETWQWILAAGCAVLNGMGKTGVPGLGILVVPLMLLAINDPKLSTGTTLVLLCVADLFAVFYYRRHAHWGRLARLSPWVALGLALGMGALKAIDVYHVDEVWFARLIGVVVLAMIAIHAVRSRVAVESLPRAWWVAAGFGIIAGFATTLANAAGPVMNLYLLSMALPKEEFMGTGAWFFCIINLVKVPLFIATGRITAETLVCDAWLLPGIAVGAMIGRQVFIRVPQRAFEVIVLALATVATIVLFIPH